MYSFAKVNLQCHFIIVFSQEFTVNGEILLTNHYIPSHK